MKIIVNSRCFVKGELLEPGKDGAPVQVADYIGKAAITCGRAVKYDPKTAKEAKKPQGGNGDK